MFELVVLVVLLVIVVIILVMFMAVKVMSAKESEPVLERNKSRDNFDIDVESKMRLP